MTELPPPQHALAHRERQVRKGKLAVLLAVAGGIATLVGGGLAIEDPALGPLLAAAGGLVALVLGALAATRVFATVRYRISTPNAPGWLAVKIAAGVGLFAAVAAVADALEVPSAPRRVLVAVLVAGFGWLVADHTARTTLFQADATGLRFGRTPVPWSAVGQLVVAPGPRPGTAELGARLLDGTAPSAVVEAARVDRARLAWAVGQSGRTDIDVVGAVADSPAPAGPRDVRLWWVAAGIVVVGALVATVVLTGGTTTEQGSPSPQQQNRYRAADVEPCDLVDVYVLKEWSTEPRIKTRPNSFKVDAGDMFACSAFSDVQTVVGRVVHLDVEVTVAEDDAAAAAVLDEARESGHWSAQGDVTEDGTVPDVGAAAEYESSIWPMGNLTRTTYVLRVRDGNLVVLLRFSSESDQSDGSGASVDTLADAATAQAKSAMRKLRDTREPPRTNEPEPGKLPTTVQAAAAAKTTGPLMAKVRAVDPCELLDRKLPGEFGQPQVVWQQAQSFGECTLAAGPVLFTIDVVEPLSKEERAELVADELAGREVFHDEDTGTSSGCAYYLPYDTTGFGAKVSVVRPSADENAYPPPWPEACATAEKYATRLGPAVEKLPERAEPAPEPTLAGKDPCVVVDDLMSTLDGWRRGPISRYNPESCQFDVRQGKESFLISLDFDRDAEQLGDEPVTIGGLSGVRFPSPEIGQCMVSLVYVPETTPDAWDAHNIGVSVVSDDSANITGALDACAVTTTAAELLIASV